MSGKELTTNVPQHTISCISCNCDAACIFLSPINQRVGQWRSLIWEKTAPCILPCISICCCLQKKVGKINYKVLRFCTIFIFPSAGQCLWQQKEGGKKPRSSNKSTKKPKQSQTKKTHKQTQQYMEKLFAMKSFSCLFHEKRFWQRRKKSNYLWQQKSSVSQFFKVSTLKKNTYSPKKLWLKNFFVSNTHIL